MIIYKSTNAIFTVFNGTISLIYVRKSWEKKFLKKKPGNKNSGEFSQVLGKNVTGNKVQCFGFLGLFFPQKKS